MWKVVRWHRPRNAALNTVEILATFGAARSALEMNKDAEKGAVRGTRRNAERESEKELRRTTLRPRDAGTILGSRGFE